MDMLLKIRIGADYSTFGLPCYATPCYQMGFFQTGFAENLGQCIRWNSTNRTIAMKFTFFSTSAQSEEDSKWLLKEENNLKKRLAITASVGSDDLTGSPIGCSNNLMTKFS